MGGAVSSGSTNDELIDNLIDGTCIRTRDVERAFRMVDRADYFLPRSRSNAYKDVAWKSGHYHLSAPCVYSEVMEGLCLKPGNRFLNIGSGTGYLSTMAGLLLGTTGVNHGVEIHEDLVQYAKHKLEMFKKYSGAIDEFEFCEPLFSVGNGLCLSHGKLGNFREYDRVYCGAACPEAFEAQVWRLVAIGGVLVMPCNDQLLQLRRTAADTWDACPLLGVTFATLVPPIADVEYTEQERKNHLKIAMTIFTVAPPSLQHLCRTLIRATVRSVVIEANPNLYKSASKPFPNPKCVLRRAPRTHTANSTNQVEEPTPQGTQRVTLSLGSNGRLNIDRSGAETEASRRARASLLGQRWINARNGEEVERGERGEGGADRCGGDGGAANVGPGGRRALSQAVGNSRVERLLEHLCQEMILVPNDAENLTRDIESDMGVLMNISSTIQMELDDIIESRQNAAAANEISEEVNLNCQENIEPHPCTSKSDNSNLTGVKKNQSANEEKPADLLTVIDETDHFIKQSRCSETADMDTDSEHENDNLTETENVTITFNTSDFNTTINGMVANVATVATNTTSDSNSEIDSSPEVKNTPPKQSLGNNKNKHVLSEVENNQMDVNEQSISSVVLERELSVNQPNNSSSSSSSNVPNSPITTTTDTSGFGSGSNQRENQKRNHRFAGFRFHNTPYNGTDVDGATSNNKQASKRSSSNSSLKKSSKRRNHHRSNSDSTSVDGSQSPNTSSSSTSSTNTISSSDDDTDSTTDNDARRQQRPTGRRARVVYLSEISGRLEANNNLGDFSTDDESDDYTSSGRLSGQEEGFEPIPLVVRSDYTRFMVERIRALPLPKRLQIYVNYDREFEEDEDDDDQLEEKDVEEILVQIAGVDRK